MFFKNNFNISFVFKYIFNIFAGERADKLLILLRSKFLLIFYIIFLRYWSVSHNKDKNPSLWFLDVSFLLPFFDLLIFFYYLNIQWSGISDYDFKFNFFSFNGYLPRVWDFYVIKGIFGLVSFFFLRLNRFIDLLYFDKFFSEKSSLFSLKKIYFKLLFLGNQKSSKIL